MSKDKSCTATKNNYSDLKLKENIIVDKSVEMCSNIQNTSTTNTAHALPIADNHIIGLKTESCNNKSSESCNNKSSTTTTTTATTSVNSSSLPFKIPSSATQHTVTTTTKQISPTMAPTQKCDTTAGCNNGQQSNQNNSHYHSHPAKRSANDFRFGKAIGEGSFSTVYLAKDIHSNKEYASK